MDRERVRVRAAEQFDTDRIVDSVITAVNTARLEGGIEKAGKRIITGVKLFMKVTPMTDVTQILSQIEDGDPSAAEQLLPLVYDELRKLAAAKLAQEKPGQTLQATALVHDAYIRLVDVEKAQHWNSRGHFFGAAAEAMRRILLNRAGRRPRFPLRPGAADCCHRPCRERQPGPRPLGHPRPGRRWTLRRGSDMLLLPAILGSILQCVIGVRGGSKGFFGAI